MNFQQRAHRASKPVFQIAPHAFSNPRIEGFKSSNITKMDIYTPEQRSPENPLYFQQQRENSPMQPQIPKILFQKQQTQVIEKRVSQNKFSLENNDIMTKNSFLSFQLPDFQNNYINQRITEEIGRLKQGILFQVQGEIQEIKNFFQEKIETNNNDIIHTVSKTLSQVMQQEQQEYRTKFETYDKDIVQIKQLVGGLSSLKFDKEQLKKENARQINQFIESQRQLTEQIRKDIEYRIGETHSEVRQLNTEIRRIVESISANAGSDLIVEITQSKIQLNNLMEEMKKQLAQKENQISSTKKKNKKMQSPDPICVQSSFKNDNSSVQFFHLDISQDQSMQEQLYKIDDAGFLLDSQDQFILDEDGKAIKISKNEINALTDYTNKIKY